MNNDFSNEFKLSKKSKLILNNKELLKKELASGKSAQEIVGFSNETMAKFYKVAYHLFENHRYSDAADAFFFLVTLNHYNHDYWLGLGMSSQLCGKFDAAIDAYEMAAICEIENPVPYFYLAKCLYAMHERENALQALNLAISYAGDLPEYAELKAQAQKALSMVLTHGV